MSPRSVGAGKFMKECGAQTMDLAEFRAAREKGEAVPALVYGEYDFRKLVSEFEERSAIAREQKCIVVWMSGVGVGVSGLLRFREYLAERFYVMYAIKDGEPTPLIISHWFPLSFCCAPAEATIEEVKLNCGQRPCGCETCEKNAECAVS